MADATLDAALSVQAQQRGQEQPRASDGTLFTTPISEYAYSREGIGEEPQNLYGRGF
jgi:hypothetical protein